MAVQQTTTQTILPEWYTQYAQGLTSRAMAASEEPYQAYSLPRIAGFSPEQEQAFGMAPTAAAAYKPYLGAAGELASAGGAGSSYGVAQPYLGEAGALARSGATGSSLGVAQPYLGAAGQFATTGGMGSSLQAASPFLARGAGSFTDPGVAGRYMSPYIDSVVSGIGDIAARNLREKILPAVNRTFVGGGTFGGSRSADFTQRAIRDAQSAALAQQTDAMRQGYKEAADLYGTEAGRALTAAGQVGTMAGTDYGRMLDASSRLGALGESTGQLAGTDYARMLSGAQNLSSMGATAGQLAGTDYSRMLDAAARMGILGESAQTSGLKEAATMESIGAQRQGLAQKSADMSYQDFLAQRDYPFTQLQKLTSVAGTPSAQGTTTVQQAPGPSGTSQLIGGLAGAAGLLGATGAFGSGGWLSGLFAEGGEVKKQVPPMKSGLGWLKDKK